MSSRPLTCGKTSSWLPRLRWWCCLLAASSSANGLRCEHAQCWTREEPRSHILFSAAVLVAVLTMMKLAPPPLILVFTTNPLQHSHRTSMKQACNGVLLAAFS